MWCEITQAGEVHFLRVQCLSQCTLEGEYGSHEFLPVRHRKVSEFLYVLVPHHTAEARVGGTIGTEYPHHAPFVPAHDLFATIAIA